MPSVITKKTPAKAAPAKTKNFAKALISAPVQAKIDEAQTLAHEITELYAQVEAIKPFITELDQKKKQLLAMVEGEYSKNEAITVGDGHGGVVRWSASAKGRKIKDMKLVKKSMGETLFMKVAKVTLADIDKYLDEAEKMNVLDEVEGSRSITIIPGADNG